MTHSEALELIKEMSEHGVWFKRFHEALKIAIVDMEERERV